jgi:hypothetical protein
MDECEYLIVEATVSKEKVFVFEELDKAGWQIFDREFIKEKGDELTYRFHFRRLKKGTIKLA